MHNKTFTVDMLVERIRNYYRRKFENSTKNEKGVDEVALVAFKGICRSCGNYGHKAADCKKKSDKKPSSNSGGGNKDIVRNYCKKKGHKEEVCWAKQKNEKNEQKEKSEAADIALTVIDDFVLSALLNDRDYFLCDSGASSHMVNNDKGLFNVSETDKSISMGNGEIVKASKVGSIKATVKDINGNDLNVVLNDVKYAPDLKFNLLSVGKMAEAGAAVTYDKSGARINVDEKKNRITTIRKWFSVWIDSEQSIRSGTSNRKIEDDND